VRWEFGPDALPRNKDAWDTLVANVGLVQIRNRETVGNALPLFDSPSAPAED